MRSKRRKRRSKAKENRITEARIRGDAARAESLSMAKRLDWEKEKRRQVSALLPELTRAQRKARSIRNGWSSATWRELRARTQALADAAAPKARYPGDE